MTKPVILFRKNYETEEELGIAKQSMPCVELRSQVPPNSLVIGRYSTLPFYKELEDDLKSVGSKLINSYVEHRWIADFDYYEALEQFTAKSWRERDFYRSDYPGPFVLKGTTNSRKQLWKTHMYAEDRRTALEVASRLANDPLIGQQGIIYRQYVPLKTLEVDSIHGLPYTNEFRFFFYKKELLSYGYYWSSAQFPDRARIAPEAIELAHKVAEVASDHVTFFVVDIAEKAEGGWIMIELNDGQMAGLSENNPRTLYSNLQRVLNGEQAKLG
jgi:hypothetical protein